MRIMTGARAESEEHRAALRTWRLHRKASRGAIAAEVLCVTLSVVLGIFALVSCAPAQPSVKVPTATAQASATVSPSPTAIPRLVYQADWSHGLAGWSVTSGWSVSGGSLQSDTGSNREVTSPYKPTMPDYAVEFRLQLISVSQTAATQFALSADPAAGGDGYIALFDHVAIQYYGFANHPHAMIYIDPMIDQDMSTFQPHDFEPGTRWRTYRVEVHGSEATLLIDGHVISWARSTKTSRLSAGPLRFSCTGVELRLSNFKVYAL
jgi:hypothetical protein